VVPDKAERVFRFHQQTLLALADLVGAAGLDHPRHLTPMHIVKRVSPTEVKTFADVYPFLAPGELVAGTSRPDYAACWAMSDAASFAPKLQARAAA